MLVGETSESEEAMRYDPEVSVDDLYQRAREPQCGHDADAAVEGFTPNLHFQPMTGYKAVYEDWTQWA
jgi:hypothetical protein